MDRKYGWVKQPKDDRDLRYGLSESSGAPLPSSYSLRSIMPPIYDQGQLGSCTAHGIARIFQAAEKSAKLQTVMPSRLFLYYNERMQEGTINDDAGAIIRDGIKACNIYGVADENIWPYDISKFKERPPFDAYNTAKSDRIKYYASLDNKNLESLKRCITHGFPIVFGVQLDPSVFESYTSGVLPSPSPDNPNLEGHCMAFGEYDDSQGEDGAFLVDNSWSKSWGLSGSIWMDYKYIINNLCSDFWMLRLK